MTHKYSIIVSILSIVLGICGIVWGKVSLAPPEQLIPKFFGEGQTEIYLHGFIPFSFIGIILGIIGLKLSVKKALAILGIILSFISLIIWLFIWFLIIGWTYA
jgi:hypothetical protein